MSTCIVPVTQVVDLLPHPNADALEIVRLADLAWQVVVPKGSYTPGQSVVYFPPDTVLLPEVSDTLGVTKYLSNGRVRSIKLRGEPSFGFCAALDGAWPVGSNLADVYQATKYVPPVRITAGDAAPEHPMFPPYTDIENLRTYPAVLQPGELVCITEKLHGTCVRIGQVQGEWLAGCGKGLMRQRPPDAQLASHWYWHPAADPAVVALVTALSARYAQVTLFGETYGKVQHLTYGVAGLAFRVFDIMADGRYVGWEQTVRWCAEYGVATVPELYSGPYDLATVAALSEGPTTLGGMHIREGVVVKPLTERTDPKIGRVILKYVSTEYLTGKHSAQEVGE